MIRIKKATINDIAAIQHIAHLTWWPAYEKILSAAQIKYMLHSIYATEILHQQIENGTQDYLLILEENEPKAFASYSFEVEEADTIKIQKLYCLPETQGKGFGARLIQEISQTAILKNVKYLTLNVNRNNTALKFYQKQGFTFANEVDIPIGPYWMNDYIMRKTL
jgi:ribosomal protein S18 acetylase RimI-like enzyme